MKFWLPNALYALKPFLLLFLGAYLLFLYDSTFLSILAYVSIGFGIWILVARLRWWTTGTIKSRSGSSTVGGQGSRVVDVTKKKSKK